MSWSSGWEDIRRLIPLSCDGSSVVRTKEGAPAKSIAGAANL